MIKMSLITKKGSEVNFMDSSDISKLYIRLKAGEGIKVRVLSAEDYVEYKAHNSFAHKIYPQPCIAPEGKDCPLCIASKSGEDGFDALYPKRRYIFAFGDIETGEIKFWDCSRSQAKDVLSQIEDYSDALGEVAFTFKRTGSGKDTSYKLNPILKLKGDLVEKFHAFDDKEVTLDLFESVLIPKPEKLMLELLYSAGFPMDKYFPDFVHEEPEDTDKETKTDKEADSPEKTF